MMDELFAFLEALASGEDLRGEVIGHDTVGDYTIDTCKTLDCGWETAVWNHHGHIIIVDRYDNREEALAGHADWCAVCIHEPVAARSVQTGEVEYFDPSVGNFE